MELGKLISPDSEEYYENWYQLLRKATGVTTMRVMRARSPNHIDDIICRLPAKVNVRYVCESAAFRTLTNPSRLLKIDPNACCQSDDTVIRAAGLWYPQINTIEYYDTHAFDLGPCSFQLEQVFINNARDGTEKDWLRLLAFVAYPVVRFNTRLQNPPLSLPVAEKVLRQADRSHLLYADTQDYGEKVARSCVRSGIK